MSAASEIIRVRAAEYRRSLAVPEDAQPWDVEWWQQQAEEAEALAELLDTEAFDHGNDEQWRLNQLVAARDRLAAAISREGRSE